MREFILYTHNGTSIIFLLLSFLILYKSFIGIFRKTTYTQADEKISFYCLISLYLQFALGIYLYFTKDSNYLEQTNETISIFFRFWQTEHIILMLFAIATAQLGNVIVNKKSKDLDRHKIRLFYFSIALALVLLSLFVAHFM